MALTLADLLYVSEEYTFVSVVIFSVTMWDLTKKPIMEKHGKIQDDTIILTPKMYDNQIY